MHIAIIGCGRIGQSLASLLLNEWYVSELSLVDVAPNLAKAVAEDFRHASVALRRDVEIEGYENVKDVEKADMVVVTAGAPRRADQSRRDLAVKNAGIIKNIAEGIYHKNKDAWFLIVTNPVDAMATLFYRVTKSGRVVGSGTHLDTIRFRSEIARRLGASTADIEGFVAGEHGEAAVPLWSTVKVRGVRLEDFVREDVATFRNEIEKAVKEIAARIIRYSGATIHGPVHAFREIIRSILLNEAKILSVASPYKIENSEVYLSLPSIVSSSGVQPVLFKNLTDEEKKKIEIAAKAIYKTFKEATRDLNLR